MIEMAGKTCSRVQNGSALAIGREKGAGSFRKKKDCQSRSRSAVGGGGGSTCQSQKVDQKKISFSNGEKRIKPQLKVSRRVGEREKGKDHYG